eukprot:scaffold279275_cov46-Prasinocladus_malaysianus.AAC.2
MTGIAARGAIIGPAYGASSLAKSPTLPCHAAGAPSHFMRCTKYIKGVSSILAPSTSKIALTACTK